MENEKSRCSFGRRELLGFIVIDFSGRLDMSNQTILTQIFDEEVEQGNYNLVIDLKNINFISSTCLGIIVSQNKRVTEQGGKLIVSGLSREVNEIFDLLNLNKFLHTLPGKTPEEAIKYFSDAPYNK